MMNRKKRSSVGPRKICLVIPTLETGGMERVASELATYFSTQPCVDVHIILYGRDPGIFYSVGNGVQIHVPDKKFDNRWRILSALSRMIYLRKTVKEIKPNAVLSFGEYWNSFVILSLLRLSFPVFISDRCSPEVNFDHFHRLLRKWLYRKASGVIAQTERAREIYKKQFRNANIRVIGNPIKEQVVSASAEHKENIILSVGRLIETKHHDLLIRVFAGISNAEWKLVIVGDDALNQKNKTKLIQLIQWLKLEDRVILAGNTENVSSYYQKSKIFAFTSSSEGFPNVVGEAMAAGLPVVSFDCVAGPSEMIEDEKNGYLVNLYDTKEFKTKLQRLMDDENLRKSMGQEAIVSIRKYSLQVIGDKFYDFIFELPSRN
jgi:GalNAc-alpha-(1->4)-GalNAc-alpha-(1->3)-diNAcBac-PP-undecaprenol alpha-1,4-N-acetyl-D-galactosaminyltransferase